MPYFFTRHILPFTYLGGILILLIGLNKMSHSHETPAQHHSHGHGHVHEHVHGHGFIHEHVHGHDHGDSHEHDHGQGHGTDGEDMWSGEAYLKRTGIQETAVISHDSVLHALQGVGITQEQVSNLDLLEIGCGAGAVTKHYAKSFGSVHAIDTSPSLLLTLSSRLPDKATYSLHALNKDSATDFDQTRLSPTTAEPKRQLAPPRSQFDVAVANLVVHHVDDLDEFMSGVYGVLKPSGWVVFTEFAKDDSNVHQAHEHGKGSFAYHQEHGKHLENGSVNAPGHFHPAFTKESIRDLLEKQGFVNVHAETRGKLPVLENKAEWPECLIVRGQKGR